MPLLADTAQIIMNLYYQSYRTDEGFFKLFHFKYIAGAVISKIMEEEYKEAKKLSRVDDDLADVNLPTEWLVQEEYEVEKKGDDNIIKLKHKPFSFPFDYLGRSVQTIQDKTDRKNDFIRIGVKEFWKLPSTPQSCKIFFAVEGDIIYFVRSKKLGKLTIHYVPDITSDTFGDDGGIVPVPEEQVITRSLDIMFKARSGTVVDMSNNSNPNKTVQTEIDNVFTNLKTKPIG
jgi:hypothetical protein